MAYTPGVARVCTAIQQDIEKAWSLTIKGNTVAVVSDGTAVLELGDIGPEAAMPVMDGKAMLFKEFAGVDAFPLCLATQDVDQIVDSVKAVAPAFGAINLEDISAPRCFEIERRLRAELDIPVFHDDQHGSAIVVLAALMNALRVVTSASRASGSWSWARVMRDWPVPRSCSPTGCATSSCAISRARFMSTALPSTQSDGAGGDHELARGAGHG